MFSTAFCKPHRPVPFSTAVAVTIGTAIVGQQGLTPYSIIIAMGSAIFLVFVATRSGIPISSSHAMVGGLLGAAIAAAGLSVVILPSPAEVDQVTGWAIIGAIGGAFIVGLFARIFDGNVRLGAILGAGLRGGGNYPGPYGFRGIENYGPVCDRPLYFHLPCLCHDRGIPF